MARWHVALASLLAAWIATFACGKGTLSAQTAGALAVVAGSATPTLPTASKPASADPVAPPLGLQSKPDVNIPITDTAPFEKGEDVLSLPSVLTKQWTPVREVPLESVVNRAYLRTRSRARHPLTLKQAIYLALRNNPAVKWHASTRLRRKRRLTWLGPSSTLILKRQSDISRTRRLPSPRFKLFLTLYLTGL